MYTYDDYQKKKQEYGFTPDQISDADDRLAQYNPDAGVALLGYKNDWLTASNDSAKAMAHAAAEDIRSRFGNYSGGENGGSFTLNGTAQYDSAWEDTLNATMRNLQSRKFEWSPETDPVAKYYEDAYRREGERAMKDTLGAVAATTGGIPSSYATAAAAQQRNYYAQQMADKYPELYQQAFDRFMQEYDREYQMLDAYMRLDDTDYNRWSDQQERDRNARLDMADAAQRAFENDIMQREMDYNYAVLDQEKRQHIENLAFDYYSLAQQADQWNAEQKLAAEQLGLEKEKLDRNASLDQIEQAYVAAEFGDFSYLKKLGVNTDSYEALWNAQMEEKLNPEQDVEDMTEDDVVDAYMAQDNGVSDTNPFNQPQKTMPDFVETPAMVTPSTLPSQRKEKANESKSDVQIAKENTQTASEIKEQQKPEALYERFLNGGQLTAKELETVQKKYGKEMQSAQVLYRRYQSGGTLTAKEREIVEKAYGKNVFNYGDTYGIK